MRRNALNKFFSRAQVARLEPTVRENAERICDKILILGKSAPFDVTTAYSHFTTDVISGYCLGDSLGLIEQKGWEPNFREPLYAQLKLMYWLRFIPLFKRLSVATAMITRRFSKDMNTLFNALVGDMPRYVRRAQDNVIKGLDDGSSVFGALLTSDLPPSEKSLERLTDEGFSLFAAGTETVSWALSVITYHLFANRELLEKVTKEVTQVIDAKSGQLPSWHTLEKLPYLGGVIYEGLRLSYGVASRSSRIPVGEDLVYRGVWAPKGSNTMREFHLAYCELYVLLSLLIVRVFPHMKLHETTEVDVTHDHDFFNPFPVSSSKGVRAIVV
ncbi:benzoate 4-monooxygenase cytochrome P450 [Neurospora crassa OR74A]|uniref:Benzoate 4-monooxygenase cytochrome P450 n=1 Tax=Neurospora crassa (strain ATCC 24698 / 74-OR23-1A / CBS 708.71 / DSM 1257 / FGSC 987) TaxID=367110 RepID=A7UXE2_NEUCR|nr:benzoate 4-monooxygenase cytochrome P450 [Neurospora crassa OR74A]EDO64909.2 benzoate 4-monooxygenase cytochrome P450 [Neurospora crassa OR74A]|eukprot:XP_001728000.2 benzoate 4-monooxygenase cytochrome P450 [Neurospora crassa OR74A]